MFEYATSFNQPLNDWNVGNVTNMNYMFFYAKSFDKDISNWNISNIKKHDHFSTHSPIDGTDKSPFN